MTRKPRSDKPSHASHSEKTLGGPQGRKEDCREPKEQRDDRVPTARKRRRKQHSRTKTPATSTHHDSKDQALSTHHDSLNQGPVDSKMEARRVQGGQQNQAQRRSPTEREIGRVDTGHPWVVDDAERTRNPWRRR